MPLIEKKITNNKGGGRTMGGEKCCTNLPLAVGCSACSCSESTGGLCEDEEERRGKSFEVSK